jgi:hypothetical protein
MSINAVAGVMNYLADKAEKPVTYMYTPPAGTPPRTGHYAKFPISVHDARALREQFSLDTQGFSFRNHETKVVNFYDDHEVKSVYYPEVERLVKEVTGATKVLVFDHNVRCAPMAQHGENAAREPVRMAHNDYTLKSGPQRVRDLLPDEAEDLLKHRFAVINVWRPVRGPVQESPLAVCDAQSIKQEDYVAMDLIYHDRVGEVYVMNFNPDHRWYYLPQQQRDEVIFLKGYDSDPAKARFTAHSAFDDPTIPPNAQARESIEVRTIVFFVPETKVH